MKHILELVCADGYTVFLIRDRVEDEHPINTCRNLTEDHEEKEKTVHAEAEEARHCC